MRLMLPYSGGLLRLAFTTIAILALLAGAWEYVQQPVPTAGRSDEMAPEATASLK
jgi:hypothetical protein